MFLFAVEHGHSRRLRASGSPGWRSGRSKTVIGTRARSRVRRKKVKRYKMQHALRHRASRESVRSLPRKTHQPEKQFTVGMISTDDADARKAAGRSGRRSRLLKAHRRGKRERGRDRWAERNRMNATRTPRSVYQRVAGSKRQGGRPDPGSKRERRLSARRGRRCSLHRADRSAPQSRCLAPNWVAQIRRRLGINGEAGRGSG